MAASCSDHNTNLDITEYEALVLSQINPNLAVRVRVRVGSEYDYETATWDWVRRQSPIYKRKSQVWCE